MSTTIQYTGKNGFAVTHAASYNIFGDGYSVDARLNVAVADYNLVRAGARRYGAHDVAADPRFVDPAANRYDVLASSPAVDSGVAGAVATIRGTPRRSSSENRQKSAISGTAIHATSWSIRS